MKDDIVFALYKDKILGSRHAFERQIKKFIKEINVSDVYLRILNYQIEKYGCVLTKSDTVPTSFDGRKQAQKARWRKHEKLRRLRNYD